MHQEMSLEDPSIPTVDLSVRSTINLSPFKNARGMVVDHSLSFNRLVLKMSIEMPVYISLCVLTSPQDGTSVIPLIRFALVKNKESSYLDQINHAIM